MQIAVASGKGGTGKTTVATNLARVASTKGRSVAYLDCDVEEPNGAIFLKPEIEQTTPASSAIPQIDSEKCNNCGQCGKICQYSAIVSMPTGVLFFPELCHGCAGCWLVCPTHAITETSREIGSLDQGKVGEMQFRQGLLNIGQVMSPPLIKVVKESAPDSDMVIIDCPPGTSCPVIEAVRGSDFVLLVTEPTAFGLHDLKLAVETVRKLEIPFGVVINRSDVGDDRVVKYCEENKVEILAEIRDDRKIAEAYSRGILAVEASDQCRENLEQLLESLDDRITSRK